MGMDDVKRISDSSSTEMGEKDLIEPGRFPHKSRNLVKQDFFRASKVPFLCENMDLVLACKTAGDLRGVSLSPACGDKAFDQYRDSQFFFVRHGWMGDIPFF
jgi:hypothetical protein